MTQRHVSTQASNLGLKGVGAFKTIDRMGNPAINVALLPFNRKNEYNGGTAKLDASLKFAGSIANPKTAGIVDTLHDLGVGVGADQTDSFAILGTVALAYGDILRLDTSVPNVQSASSGGGGDNAATGFGTAGGGRRLMDDTIDTILTLVARGLLNDPNATLGDNVPANEDGFLPNPNFPFLHEPHQPLPRSGAPNAPDTNVDDGTRN
jgi:hypothetical protein